jgi:deazaflavin-dependent oxidoreductase (nitroreductase family)
MLNGPAVFARPGLVERILNSAVGVLVRLGMGPSHIQLLEVRGRKTGCTYVLPVDLLVEGRGSFLVAPRGHTQWARNAMASREVTLRRGRRSARHALRSLADAEKPEILRAYLDRFHREVQRFFPVRAGSPAEAFVALAARYPVFELLPRN